MYLLDKNNILIVNASKQQENNNKLTGGLFHVPDRIFEDVWIIIIIICIIEYVRILSLEDGKISLSAFETFAKIYSDFLGWFGYFAHGREVSSLVRWKPNRETSFKKNELVQS